MVVKCSDGFIAVGDGCVKISPWGKEAGGSKWRIELTCPDLGLVTIELALVNKEIKPEIVSFKIFKNKNLE